ncbi:helix-turn-helix domain-containing protein [Bradyrhizobium sp. SSUT112]|uniref:AraC family transcriptional regulator n=1 Tax=Bradyrhizobium sp. SSUT112 TaxID=3040604 RepID=UPI00244D3BE6|nr:helix-turn-helix domain-containing protein [Bradyrhizobium sp. SSUT112]MDH2351200.1 helix-turn-helix domain-containing protein [Bradyrhizobium sp. SSUT112]
MSNEMKPMTTGSGTATFANPDDYQAGILGASVNLILTGGDFKARLTWLNLHHLHVLRGNENLPRIAYISLTPARVFVSFLARVGPPSTYSGAELRFGDIVFHRRGERLHHRTPRENQWGLISLPPDQLAACGKALTGLEIFAPPASRMLRPSRDVAARLLRLHSRACHLAETRHELFANPEVARSLEQELLHALINCLTADDAGGKPETRQRHADIMVQFEEALAAQSGRPPSMPELCADIGVPERTLRICCAEFLDMSPTRYLLLRRLNAARSALLRADPATASVAEVARGHHFLELGRFAVTYRTVFGEMPSTTLRRSPAE